MSRYSTPASKPAHPMHPHTTAMIPSGTRRSSGSCFGAGNQFKEICRRTIRRVGGKGKGAKENGDTNTCNSLGTADESDADPLENIFSTGCLLSLLDISLPESGADATLMEHGRISCAIPTAVNSRIPSHALRLKQEKVRLSITKEETTGAKSTSRSLNFTDTEGRDICYNLKVSKKESRPYFLELHIDGQRIKRGNQSINVCEVSSTIRDGSNTFLVTSSDVLIASTSLHLICKVGALQFHRRLSPEIVQSRARNVIRSSTV